MTPLKWSVDNRSENVLIIDNRVQKVTFFYWFHTNVLQGGGEGGGSGVKVDWGGAVRIFRWWQEIRQLDVIQLTDERTRGRPKADYDYSVNGTFESLGFLRDPFGILFRDFERLEPDPVWFWSGRIPLAVHNRLLLLSQRLYPKLFWDSFLDSFWDFLGSFLGSFGILFERGGDCWVKRSAPLWEWNEIGEICRWISETFHPLCAPLWVDDTVKPPPDLWPPPDPLNLPFGKFRGVENQLFAINTKVTCRILQGVLAALVFHWQFSSGYRAVAQLKSIQRRSRFIARSILKTRWFRFSTLQSRIKVGLTSQIVLGSRQITLLK